MTTSRFSLLFAALFVLLAPVPTRAKASTNADKCGKIDPFAERRCVAKRVSDKERLMKRLLVRARHNVELNFKKSGNWDTRSSPRFLDASQLEWRKFVDNNCTVTGAFDGGSNSAISDNIESCYEEELDQRINFLRGLADGSLAEQ
jgi:uncharacterized protein YecT (DUF1311 family)